MNITVPGRRARAAISSRDGSSRAATSAVEQAVSASPLAARTKKAGSRPAWRAIVIAVAAAASPPLAIVRNGPLSGLARSSAGSAIASAAATLAAPSASRTGPGVAAARWLVSFSVTARSPEISRSALPNSASAASRALSTASRSRAPSAPSIRKGQPRRRASIARAARRAPRSLAGASLKMRTP